MGGSGTLKKVTVGELFGDLEVIDPNPLLKLLPGRSEKRSCVLCYCHLCKQSKPMAVVDLHTRTSCGCRNNIFPDLGFLDASKFTVLDKYFKGGVPYVHLKCNRCSSKRRCPVTDVRNNPRSRGCRNCHNKLEYKGRLYYRPQLAKMANLSPRAFDERLKKGETIDAVIKTGRLAPVGSRYAKPGDLVLGGKYILVRRNIGRTVRGHSVHRVSCVRCHRERDTTFVVVPGKTGCKFCRNGGFEVAGKHLSYPEVCVLLQLSRTHSTRGKGDTTLKQLMEYSQKRALARFRDR